MGKLRTHKHSGITLLELILVVLIMAVLMAAVAPLVRTTYISWITADRRAEIVETGRVGMDKMVREIRFAWDLASATDTTFIEYNPQWASGSVYRFEYDAPGNDFHYGATPTFKSDSLAAPIDSWSYTSYNRRLDESIIRYRQINAFKFRYGVSDERQLLPQNVNALNPLYFRSQAQMRMSREGYFFAKSYAFATESYYWRLKNEDDFCVKVFNDRVDPNNMMTKSVIISNSVGEMDVLSLKWFQDGDYFATCCTVRRAKPAQPRRVCDYNNDPNTNIMIWLQDFAGEWSIIQDKVWFHN